MLSKSITYIQGEPFKENKYQTYQENNDEQEFTFDHIQQDYIPYNQIRFNYDREHNLGAGSYGSVHSGYNVQRIIDE